MHLRIVSIGLILLVLTLSAGVARGESVKQITHHGITWTFDRPVQAGQFITGDWWVVGPVTVTGVTPAPGPVEANGKLETPKNRWGDTSLRDDKRMRNGSMVVLSAGQKQGYDSRGQSYDPKLSVSFPFTLEASQSLISTTSNATVPVDNFAKKIMWATEKKSETVLQAAAVLSVLRQAPPADAFRPPYVGKEKPIYRAGDLQWKLLKNLPAPKIDPKNNPGGYELRVPEDWEAMERYFQRPWLEHLCSWEQQQLNPNENQPNYGREHSRLVSIASLMLHLDVPKERKEKLLIGLVQYGIDVSGVAKAGGSWNWGGGHTSGRKWPMLFASLMLNAPAIRDLPETAVFHEDAQTYYGTGWAGQSALYWMVEHHGRRDHYEEKPPEQWQQWDKSTESYRLCCNGSAWVGTALAARLTVAVATWNHDAYFDYCDRWMAEEDEYAANRGTHPRPKEETKALDPFVTAMWRTYRDKAPEQKMAGNPQMFVWEARGFKWVPNPKPDAKAIADHVEKVRGAK